MTDFNVLYQKFQLSENEAEKLRDLYLFSKGFQEGQPLFTIETIISEHDGETMNNSEVNNGKLV